MGFQVGFSRMEINPDLGVDIGGYFIPRKTEGYLDDIEVNALALKCDDDVLVMLVMDLCQILQKYNDVLRENIAKATGIPFGRFFMSCTHTHTSPIVRNDDTAGESVRNYFLRLQDRLIEATNRALADLKPACAGYREGKVPGISHCRRIRMKDGSVLTNPGIFHPDAVEEVSAVDERVNVLRFDREGGESIILANYGNHPDSIGGSKISADYPGFFRRAFERAVPGTKCIYLNGAEGDVNFIDVWPKEGDLNDTVKDFDDVQRGYDHSRFLGESLAGAVLQVFRKVVRFEPEGISVQEEIAPLPANVPTEEEAKRAHVINDLHKAGRDSELPYTGMMLTTIVAEAERMVRYEHGPASVPTRIMAVSLGPVAFVGIAGEPFTGVGFALKETAPFKMVLPVVNTNGNEGYFPMMSAYEEGGYESRSSKFRAGTAEYIIEEAKKLLGKAQEAFQ